LPAEDVVRGIRPRRALIALIPGEKIEEQARLIEAPLARARPPALEDLAEELLGLPPSEEDVLPRRVVVAVARRDHHAFDAEAHHVVEEIGDVVRILAGVQRAVHRHAEAALARELDRADCLVERAFAANRCIVALAVAVEMDRPREIRRRLVLVDLFLEQQRVRAEIDEFLPRDDASNDLGHLLVDQRLAARDRDDGRAALVDRAKRILDAHALFQNIRRIIDFSAAGASEIALEERLEHQHERIALIALELLLEDVARYPVLLYEWNAHAFSLLLCPSGLSCHRCRLGPPSRSITSSRCLASRPPPASPVRAGASEQPIQEVAPDVRPFQLEPRRESLRTLGELPLERVDSDPAPVRDLADVHVQGAVVATMVYPAILVLRADR